jgi:16S rRNA processing protein RimM
MSSLGSADHPEPVERLAIGVIVGPHGVQGELRMLIWTHFPERIPTLKRIYLGDEPDARRLQRARLAGRQAILRVDGIDDRNAAEERRGQEVRIDLDQAAPLEADEYFHFQLIGLDVYGESGARIGELTDILETGANDVYVVTDEQGRDQLFPALKSVVLEVDLDGKRMVVRPLDYLEG